MAHGESYEQFVEKFKPKKTTDDCYTPQEVYEVVLDYCIERWGVDPERVRRPFWSGGDYEAEEYPEDSVVIDNPPFSILSKIVKTYIERGVKFFLFAPGLTLFSVAGWDQVDHIATGVSIKYENGAMINTGFITNLENRYVIETAPELGERLKAAQGRKKKKKLAKHIYPDSVITAAQAGVLARRLVLFKVPRGECLRIQKLDAMTGCGIYGYGALLSERAAAERAAAGEAAERAAAERAAAGAAAAYTLSERELELQRSLSPGGDVV